MQRLALLLVLLLAFPAFAAPKPNILLMVTDDQGWWDLGMRGNKDIDTPVLDKLSGEGVSFSRFYVAPVCAPTRAGLMTGRYYLRTGLYNTRFGGDSMGLDEITVAQLLKKAGYRTGCFGKWHLGKYGPYQPQTRGFDEFLGHYHGHIERYDYPDQLVHNGKPVECRGYVTDLFTDAAISFIRSNRQRPFFCYVPYNAPHSPWVVGTSHDGQPRGDALIEKYLKRGLALREARIYAMVDLVDQNVGRLLKTVDELGLRENTVVLFMSDNGGVSRHFKAGLRSGKGSVFEGGVRSPLFVRWPGHFPAQATVEAQASHVDLLPTFCELAGVPLPSDRKLDGRSLLPVLKAGTAQKHQPYVYHTWDRYTPRSTHRWSISDQRYKLLCQIGIQATPVPAKHWQLYDLTQDLGEQKNIAKQHPDIVKRLRAEFERWFADVTKGHSYTPVPIPVGHRSENPVELQPSWATWEGPNVQYTFRGYDWDTIDSWSTPGEQACWKLDVHAPGRYEVTVRYGCNQATAGGQLRLSAGDAALEHVVQATPTGDVFHEHRLGVLSLKKGPVTLCAKVAKVKNGELMRLNLIWLRRLED